MKLWRNDPVTILCKKYYRDASLNPLNAVEAKRHIHTLLREKKLLEAIGYCTYYIDQFSDQIVFHLLKYDALYRAGFFLDAKNLIDELTNEASLVNEQILIRLIKINHQLALYNDNDLFFLKYTELILSEIKLLDIVFQILIETQNFRRIEYFEEIYRQDPIKYKALASYISVPISKKLNIDRNILYSSKLDDEHDRIEIVWSIYYQGERSIQFFSYATKILCNEVQSSSRRLFFLREAIKYHPERLDFLYDFLDILCFRRFYEHSYYELKKVKLKSIIKNPLYSTQIKKSYIIFLLKYQHW